MLKYKLSNGASPSGKAAGFGPAIQRFESFRPSFLFVKGVIKMATKIPNVDVKDRDKSVNPRQLRREGRLPATYYGKGSESISFEVDKKTFTHLYYTKNPNLVTLKKNGNSYNAMVKNVQVDPVSLEVLNIEFIQVKADQTLRVNVPLAFENEAPVAKQGAMILQLVDELEVECFPQDIPESITFDLSGITEVGISITVADLTFPEGVKTALPEDTAVLNVTASKVEEEEESTEAGEVSAEVPTVAEDESAG